MQEIFNSKSELDVYKTAQKIATENHIIYCNGRFYRYEHGCYSGVDLVEIQKMVMNLLKDKFRTILHKEIQSILKGLCHIEQHKLNNTKYLNISNGLFDIESMKLYSHSADIYSTVQLDVLYKEDAQCPLWQKTLDQIFEGDQDRIYLLQEFFGLCLTTDTSQGKALFLVGEGANGKSTLIETLQMVVGRHNYAAVPMSRFNTMHYLAGLQNKLVNISSEVKVRSLIDDEVFKKLVTGDTITADQKYEKAITFQPCCKLIFALNKLPRVEDKSHAFYRRVLILRFDRIFTEDEQNKNLTKQLRRELDGIFLWMLRGLQRLRKRGSFEITSDMEMEVNQFRNENNNVRLFVEDMCLLDSDATVGKTELYCTYRQWCRDSGHYSLSENKFRAELLSQFPELETKRSSKSRNWKGISIT